jgi:hypothetical protein
MASKVPQGKTKSHLSRAIARRDLPPSLHVDGRTLRVLTVADSVLEPGFFHAVKTPSDSAPATPREVSANKTAKSKMVADDKRNHRKRDGH